MTVTEKVAYLKGLVDGIGLDTEKKEGKILAAIIDTLEDISLDLEALHVSTQDLGEQIDFLSEDLTDLEDVFYAEDDEDEDDGDYFPHHHHHHHHGRCCDLEDDEDNDEDECCCCGHGHDGYAYEVTCPSCDADIVIDEDDLDKGSVVCPGCGETLEFEFDEDDDEVGDEDVAEQNDEE
jgi:predicted Zn finger-like uncharacterized protein